MNTHRIPGRILAASIVLLAGWILHGFAEALATACGVAVASWPLYERFRSRLPQRIGDGTAAAMFTAAMTVCVLAPLVFACAALVGEAHTLLQGVAAADSQGLPAPAWLADVPSVGPWLARRWQSQLAQPGALLALGQHTDPADLIGWARSLARFTMQQGVIIAFAILLLCFFYGTGAELASELDRTLQRMIGKSAGRYIEVAVRSVRASATSMLAVGLFDAAATALAYAATGAPRPLVWAAITGALAAVPFLGYAAVAAMALQSAVSGAAAPVLPSLALGCCALLVGDKVVRPVVAREGLQVPFVWVLMGCLGGFEVLGMAGLVFGPLVLALGREMWRQRVNGRAPGDERNAA